MPRLVLLLLALAGMSVPAFAARIEIASEEEAARSWERANQVPPPAWPAIDAGLDRACVNLAFQIDSHGVPGTPVLLRAWSPGETEAPEAGPQLAPYTQSAAATLAGWRYRPSEGNSRRRPLITNVVFVFARHAGADLQQLRRSCLVGDLRDFLYRQSEQGQRRGNLNKGLIERSREEYPPVIPEGCVRHAGWCE